jgi:hypothetical protein
MEELAQYIFERDRHEFSLGDTLDIKTGLILASLAFLAIQSSSLIDSNSKMSIWQMIIQIVSIAALISGGALSVIELWPRNYDREAVPDKYAQWLSDMERYQEQYPDAPVDNLRSARLEAAKARVRTNGRINIQKSGYMFLAFYCLMLSFVANVLTLLMRLF